MFGLKQCTYLKYHQFSSENAIGSGFVTCSIGNSIKSSRFLMLKPNHKGERTTM